MFGVPLSILGAAGGALYNDENRVKGAVVGFGVGLVADLVILAGTVAAVVSVADDLADGLGFEGFDDADPWEARTSVQP